MKTTEAQVRATKKYQERMTVQVIMRLNRGTDADILQKLGEVGSKQGFIKEAIRAYMKAGH